MVFRGIQHCDYLQYGSLIQATLLHALASKEDLCPPRKLFFSFFLLSSFFFLFFSFFFFDWLKIAPTAFSGRSKQGRSRGCPAGYSQRQGAPSRPFPERVARISEPAKGRGPTGGVPRFPPFLSQGENEPQEETPNHRAVPSETLDPCNSYCTQARLRSML